MNKKTRMLLIVSSFCFVVAVGVFSVFAAKSFNFNIGGSIEFVAPGVEATVSAASLSGISKKTGSGEMSTFTTTRNMSESDIAALDGVKSWTGIALLFDDDSNGKARITFTITNNSNKETENIMVELSSNTTNTSVIQATPSADFCIAPGANYTFTIDLSVTNTETSSLLNDLSIKVELTALKPDQVLPADTAQQTQDDKLSFTTNSTTKTATFAKYTGTATEVEIPAVVKDDNGNLYTVTEIRDGRNLDDYAFEEVYSTITSIILPSTLTKIGNYAFYECSKLTGNLIIPNGVTTIGSYSFYNCKNLTGELIIPKSVTSIGDDAFGSCSGFSGILKIGANIKEIGSVAFAACTGLDGIVVDSGNPIFYSKNNCVITKQDKVLVFGCNNSVIPQDEGILKIGNYAFDGFTGLAGSVAIPNGVTTIGTQAFDGCTGLSSDLIIPESVTIIGSYAFDDCINFASITVLATTPPTLGDSCCFDKNGTCKIYVPSASVSKYKSATYWSEYSSRITAITA